MSVFITTIAMSKQNKRFIPAVIDITFSNGEQATYERSVEKMSRAGNQLANLKPPKYDLVDEKSNQRSFNTLAAHFSTQLRHLDKQYKSAVMEADRVFALEKGNIEDALKNQRLANDQLYATLSKEMLEEYQNLKKVIHRKAETLKDPASRIEMMTQWLRETGGNALVEAALMLDTEADYIVKKLKSSMCKWKCFLSHVQSRSGDAVRNIKDALEKNEISAWLDKTANRVDMRGMIDGIVDSSIFVIVLTKEYFERPYCLYEYCIAAVAGKPMITISESETRHGGGPIESFEFIDLFKHLLDHEVIEIHRKYWDSFIQTLRQRIEGTLKSTSLKSVGKKFNQTSKFHGGEWDSKATADGLKIHEDRVTVTFVKDIGTWLTAVGRQEIRKGCGSFSVKIVNYAHMGLSGHVSIGVVPQKPPTGLLVGSPNFGWGYLASKTKGYAYNQGRVIAYGEGYNTGDIITVELDFDKKSISFSKNGKSYGVAYQNLKGPVFPAVTIYAPGTSVQLMSAYEA